MIWTKQPIKTSIKEINDKVVSPTDLGNFSSESDLISALNTKLNGMQDNEVSQIRFQMTSATASFKAYAYTGMLTRIANQYASLNVTVCTSYAAALCVVGSKNTHWKFEELALKSDITALNSKTMYTEGDFTELNQSLVTQTSRIYVRNGIATCTIAFKITAQVPGYNNLLTLPIKPSDETNVIFSSLNGTSVPGYINATTGKLVVRANMPVSEWYATNFSFML